jgi:two-component system, OmpR family, response regulator
MLPVPQAPALILIIDDIPANLGVMVDLLETEGHRVAVAKNGPEGLRRAENDQPDLILLDVMMPGMDGPTTLRALQASLALAAIPVIFMTAKVQAREIERCLELGAVGVVGKPFDPMKLPDQIRRIFHGECRVAC